MKIMNYALLLLILLFLMGCKEKTEQMESAELIDTETAHSVSTEATEEAVPAQEIKAQEPKQETAKITETPKPLTTVEEKKESYKVTFLEIGSVNCIPCKMMQPIMKEIESEYKGIVKVEFYDLGVDRQIGSKFNIRVMPTQVFLDANGKEFFRHEGFYPKAELAKMLDEYLAKL